MPGLTDILEGVFWLALGLLAYSQAGYPLLLALASLVWRRDSRVGEALPSVTLLIPAHNEAAVMDAKLRNALAIDYPRKSLQVRVISDGSEDGTDEIAREYAPWGVELQRVDMRGGKPSALNAAAPHARGEILVLCDANTMLAPEAVRRLVRHFADPEVGAVSGDVRLLGVGGYGQGEGAFWKLERFVQRCESNLGSAIGVDGGLYALRRELYTPNAPDPLIEDFVIAMNVAKAGKRVLYDPAAVAYEDSVQDSTQDYRRRVRTIAGGFQSLFEGRGRPGVRQPWLLGAYLSHKALRWLGPAVLMLLLASNAGVAALQVGEDWDGARIFYAAMLAAQVGAYGLAAGGHAMRRRAMPRWMSLPYYFALANAAAAAGFWRWARRSQRVTWTQADRAVAQAPGDRLAEQRAGAQRGEP